MTERYDQTVAVHYSAYRPPLHRIILERVFSGEESFPVGLDVGCGTGYSALALAERCGQVYGIDPSPSMLNRATLHERVIYLNGAGESVPLPDRSVDVVTFAGSLFYANADATYEEMRRVCRTGAVVVPYDFEILLEEVMRRHGMDPRENGPDYDHQVNFTGIPGFAELVVGSERVTVEVTGSELAHVLLSDSHRFDYFASKYRRSDPFPALERELQSPDDGAMIEADVSYSKYRITAA